VKLTVIKSLSYL